MSSHKKYFDLVINSSKNYLDADMISDADKNELSKFKETNKTINNFDKETILLVRKIDKEYWTSGFRKYINTVNKLFDKGISLTYYKSIGFLESNDSITIVSAFIIEDRFLDLSEEWLAEIYQNDDEDYKY